MWLLCDNTLKFLRSLIVQWRSSTKDTLRSLEGPLSSWENLWGSILDLSEIESKHLIVHLESTFFQKPLLTLGHLLAEKTVLESLYSLQVTLENVRIYPVICCETTPLSFSCYLSHSHFFYWQLEVRQHPQCAAQKSNLLDIFSTFILYHREMFCWNISTT